MYLEVLTSSVTTENSRQFSGSDFCASRTRLSLVDDGSWSGTVKIAVRPIGRGQEGASTYNNYAALTNVDSGVLTAGSTGVTAAGVYEFDDSGLEWRLEHTRSAGTLSARAVQTIG